MTDTLSGQSVRYVMVGAAVYACDVGVFALLVHIGLSRHYLLANVASKCLAATIGFLLHKHFTFRWPQHDRPLRQAARYVSLLVFNLGLSTVLIWVAVRGLGWPALAGKIATEAVIAGISFLVSRSLVFRRAARVSP